VDLYREKLQPTINAVRWGGRLATLHAPWIMEAIESGNLEIAQDTCSNPTLILTGKDGGMQRVYVGYWLVYWPESGTIGAFTGAGFVDRFEPAEGAH
jgi:hypothetical protein